MLQDHQDSRVPQGCVGSQAPRASRGCLERPVFLVKTELQATPGGKETWVALETLETEALQGSVPLKVRKELRELLE